MADDGMWEGEKWLLGFGMNSQKDLTLAEMRICLYLAWEEKIFLNIITTKC